MGSVKVGLRTEDSNEGVTLRYFHTDHLGSIAVISNENGVVVERLSYDPWGKRRHANGADDPTGSITSESTRGFTGHEHLGEFGLVHMNGRVYDPLIARMMSADPVISDAMNPQTWNGYSYVGNDPLAFTDPTGYSFLSRFFRGIGNFFKSIVKTVLRIVVQVVLTVVLAPLGPAAPIIAAAAAAALITGISGGKLGDILKSAAIAGATTAAFMGFGNAINPAAAATHANVDPTLGFAQASGGTTPLPHIYVQATRSTIDAVVPGAHYSSLAQQAFHSGDYWTAAGYGIVSLGDAALGIATAGASTRLQATLRAGGSAAKGATTLFRAVGPAELADIKTTGALRNLGPAEGKYFTTSAEEASAYAKQAVKAFGDEPYTIVRTEVPNSIFKGLSPATVDRGIPAWVIPNNRLPGLVPQVINHSPLPPVRF